MTSWQRSAERTLSGEPVDGRAVFSPCLRYRYVLARRWDASLPVCAWLMLNPSTADADRDDPTVRRCRRLADAWGFGAIEVINIFAWRSTDPAGLRRTDDPVGPRNDPWIRRVAKRCDTLVCAWGEHGQLKNRDRRVLNLLHQTGVAPFSLGENASGRPKHPLYTPKTVKPIRLALTAQPQVTHR